MSHNVIYICLDVDDTQYHGSARYIETCEVINFMCRPTLKGLLDQLIELYKALPTTAFTLCYEASYVGYTLQQDFTEKGYHRYVVAPCSIPSPRGKQVKTYRIDAT